MLQPNKEKGPVKIFAERISKEKDLQNLTHDELGKMCSKAYEELKAQGLLTKNKPRNYKWAERLRKIAQTVLINPAPSCAKRVYQDEIKVICHALNKPTEYMLSPRWNNKTIYINPLFNEESGNLIKSLIKNAEEKAKILTGWAEFLPCSLETEEFMKQHHQALHKEKERDEIYASDLADKYNQFGDAHRKRFYDPNRNFIFEHLMFHSHLLNISGGKKEYKSISKNLREECLRNLAEMVLDRKLQLRMFIAPDEKCEKLKEEMRGNDSMLVFGRHFTIWRLHNGDYSWQDHEDWINKHADWADEFKYNSIRQSSEVADVLNDLAERTK